MNNTTIHIRDAFTDTQIVIPGFYISVILCAVLEAEEILNSYLDTSKSHQQQSLRSPHKGMWERERDERHSHAFNHP